MDARQITPRFSHHVKITLLAWFSMLGVDFFLHAGLLAPLYAAPSPFLLPPQRAFELIPVGYVAFLGLAVLLVWLVYRLQIKGGKRGAVFGLQLGALAWGALILGLYSISTASPALLAGWWAGQTIELGIAGFVVGWGYERLALRALFARLAVFVFLLMVLSIILQNI